MRLPQYTSSFVAVAIVAILYLLSRTPQLPEAEWREVASRFSFERFDLPQISTKTPRTIREVHPSLRHWANWISFVGAAVSVGDLDQNGLSDDLVYVDSRYDEVTVCPVPETGVRFEPFILAQDRLPVERQSTAPMGTLLGDFNEDGWQDILVYFWGRSPIIYLRNAEAASVQSVGLQTFVPVELTDPPQVWHTSCMTQADLDADGHLDLVVGNYNPDNARTLDPTDVDGPQEEMMASFGRATNGGKTRLMLWAGPTDRDGDPLFAEAETALSIEVARGWTFAVGAADLNDDLKPELYLANDFGADSLLYNESEPGNLKFRLLYGRRSLTTARSMAIGKDSFNGMGVDFADLNTDGRMDFLVSNITSDYGLHQSNLVFIHSGESGVMNDGVAPFQNRTEKMGLARGGWTWDSKFGDFDNDGELELMQATGFMNGQVNRWPELHELALANEELASYPIVYPRLGKDAAVANKEHCPFFVKTGDRYYDIAKYLGEDFSEPALGRGIATADVDGDGRLDFAIANNWGDSYFFRNRAVNPGDFLGLHLRIPLPDRDNDRTGNGAAAEQANDIAIQGHPDPRMPSSPAIGAHAAVHFQQGGSKHTRVAEVDGGNGHSGQRAPDLHFGLGRIDEGTSIIVDIRWRDRQGNIASRTIEGLSPGWHTVYLRNQ